MALFSALSRAGIRHLAFRQVIQRVPGLAGAVDLHLAAGPRPDIVGRFGLAGDQASSTGRHGSGGSSMACHSLSASASTLRSSRARRACWL
jgi:hypothetical protein